jgi:ribonuclease Z
MTPLPQSVPLRHYSRRPLSNSPKRLRMQIYGPYGLRKFVRVNLQLTLTELRGRYAVHELLGPSEQPSITCETDLLHVNENPGNNIRSDGQGLWRNVVTDKDWTVHAGPLQHRGAYFSTKSHSWPIYISCDTAPTVGYVFQENVRHTNCSEHYVPHIQRNMHHLRTETTTDSRIQESILRRVIGRRESVSLPDGTTLNPPPTGVPGRKLVILGDTCDSRGIMPLCYDASLLVHEATQMAIPRDMARQVSQWRKGCSEEEARKAALKHGHSTAAMAGEFARDIRAKRLCLNHFSVKYV